MIVPDNKNKSIICEKEKMTFLMKIMPNSSTYEKKCQNPEYFEIFKRRSDRHA